MSTPTDALTFGAATFMLRLSTANERAPRPLPALDGEWVHIPYGGNKYEHDGASGPTTWTPQGGIIVPPQDGWMLGQANTNYSALEALYGRFATLKTRWGTFTARLAALTLTYDDTSGEYSGSATWEWA